MTRRILTMNEANELNIKVNPTSNTAITTLIMLANAHYDKACLLPYITGAAADHYT